MTSREASLSEIRPPKHAPRYRRWREWFDPGHFEHGHVYRETKWRAQKARPQGGYEWQTPFGTLVEHPNGRCELVEPETAVKTD